MNKKQKQQKNLYNFDYESKEEKKIKAKKKKAEEKSALKENNNSTSRKEEKNKKYNDEIIIGVTKYPEKKKNYVKAKSKKVKHQKVKKKSSKKEQKNINKLLKCIILIILILGTIAFAMISPIFNLKDIKIIGNIQISKEEIISLSQIQLEENIFRINKVKTINNIKQNAYISTVTVKKKLPNTLEINVEERTPKFMLEYGNGYVYINNQGYMLEISSIKKELPIIMGTSTSKENYKTGNRLEETDLIKLGTIIKIMNAAKNSEISQLITTINVENENNFILYLETEKKTVYLGDCSNLETRILFLIAILEKEKGVEGEIFINMNLNTDNAYFRESV